MQRGLFPLIALGVLAVAPAAASSAPAVIAHVRPDVGPIDLAMRRDGEVSTPDAPIGPGDIAGTMPFAYVRTGVLQSDLIGRSIFNRGARAATRGAPGYFVGRYRTQTQFAGMTNELWCFLPSRVGGSAESICVLVFGDRGAAIEVRNHHPFWVDPGVGRWPTGEVIDPVVIDERPIAIIADRPTLQYRFLGWSGTGARVEFLVGGRAVGRYEAPFEPDASTQLGLIGGSYLRLTRDAGDANRARSAFVASGARMGR